MSELAGERSLVRRRMAGQTMLMVEPPDREAEAGGAEASVPGRLLPASRR